MLIDQFSYGLRPCSWPLSPVTLVMGLIFAPTLLRLAIIILAPMIYCAVTMALFAFFASTLCDVVFDAKTKEAAAKDVGASGPGCESKVEKKELSSARLEETTDGVRVIIGAPGVQQEDLEVTHDEHTLSVKGETERDNEVYVVDRQIRLPSVIDLASAQCTHNNGVLTITLKKKVAKLFP